MAVNTLAEQDFSIDIVQGETILPAATREVRLAGLMDDRAVQLRGDELGALVAGVGDGIVLVDLSNVRYLSRAGVRLLLQASKALHAAGGEFHVAAPEPHMMVILATIGHAPPFGMYRTLDEARETLLNAAMYEWLAEAVI